MDPYILLLAAAGALILLIAWLPMVLKELPLSLPMFCVACGAVAFGLSSGDTPNPLRYPHVTERLTEIVVIVALTGAGLKLDRPFGWRRWSLTWRLLAVAMPLSILGIALLGHALLGLGLAAAVLLGAALAPTDPVLASDVQVGPPRSGSNTGPPRSGSIIDSPRSGSNTGPPRSGSDASRPRGGTDTGSPRGGNNASSARGDNDTGSPQNGEEDEVRFTLTAEAGLNDGLSFPFVNLAVALALAGSDPADWLGHWLGWDVAWKLGVGLGMGWAIGWGLGWLTFHMPNRARLSRTGDGFVALGATFLTYGATQLVDGYGFLAVFVAAVAMRAAERGHHYHEQLHDFAEQTERLLMMVLLVLFGGALAGGLLAPLGWDGALAALLFVFLVRPLAGMVSLVGSRRPLEERLAISFFGIRGLGSFYYLAYALNAAPFAGGEQLWAVLGCTVLLSIGLHGMTVTPAMRWLDARRQTQGVLPLEA